MVLKTGNARRPGMSSILISLCRFSTTSPLVCQLAGGDSGDNFGSKPDLVEQHSGVLRRT
jgi:hypothetical protein